MIPKIKVAILEDHLSIIDGYLYRLSRIQELGKIVTMVARGGVYFSQGAYRELRAGTSRPVLPHR